MKARVFSKRGCLGLLLLMALSLVFISAAYAGHCYNGYCKQKFVNVPMALCTTSGTNIALPAYVCCGLVDKKGHNIWRNVWVAGTCSNANPYAMYDMGCKVNSPVYSTGAPIAADCQFSHSTGRYFR